MRNDWYDAALQIIADAEVLPGADVHALQPVRAAFLHAKGAQPVDLAANVIDEREMERHFPKALPAQLAANLMSVIPDGPGRMPMTQRLREAYIRFINAGDWSTIERQIMPREGPALTSRITPVNEAYDETYDGESGAEGKRYGRSGLGSMSPRLSGPDRSAAETHRPTNLWHTTLTAGGQTLFDAFRSGAFADPVLQASDERVAADSKLRGVLEAMVIKQLRGRDPDEASGILEGRETLMGTVVAIDLLSDAAKFGDASLVETHHAAIKFLNNKPLDYQVVVGGRPCTVKAQFRIVDFNLAVNQAASPLLGAGSRQATRNKSSHDVLAGLVAEFDTNTKIAMGFAGEAEGADLKKRMLQVDALYAQFCKLGATHVGDYASAAILANLAHLMGHEVHFNCKSGKDRTGLMDANSKHLAAELGRRRADPELAERYLTPGADWLTASDGPAAQGRQQMIWESGNLQVLERNVGGQSLKVGDVASLPGSIDSALRKNLGGSEMLKELRGLERYTMIDHATDLPKAKDAERAFRRRAQEELARLIREAEGAPPERRD